MVSVKEQSSYLDQFALLQQLKGADPAWLKEQREEAMARFESRGFPTLKEEPWRFTNLAPMTRTAFEFSAVPSNGVAASQLEALPFANLGGPRLVFVDGAFAPSLSDVGDPLDGLLISNLAAMVGANHPELQSHYSRFSGYLDEPFVALNTAFAQDGFVIELTDNTRTEQPLHLLHLTTAKAQAHRVHSRNLVIVGDNCQATLIESYLTLSEGVYFCNPLTEVLVGRNSIVDHYRLQNESRRAFHIAWLHSRQERDSNYRFQTLDLGSRLTRNDLTCVLAGEGAQAELDGLYLLNRNQHVDNYTTLQHSAPHCDSRELFKGILNDRARGIFRGRIIVDEGAQKTDSKQTNNNLLLSDDAFINTKPQLEIYADDVKCTHGATTGQLDPQALFYLRSRGLSEKAARSLLIYAFARELVDRIAVKPLADGMADYLTAWLPQAELVREVYGS